jgi:hypothetical protein
VHAFGRDAANLARLGWSDADPACQPMWIVARENRDPAGLERRWRLPVDLEDQFAR